MNIDELMQFGDKQAILKMGDGEVATVRVNFVDREYNDIIVDVVETSRPERYQNRAAAYTFAAEDIVAAPQNLSAEDQQELRTRQLAGSLATE